MVLPIISSFLYLRIETDRTDCTEFCEVFNNRLYILSINYITEEIKWKLSDVALLLFPNCSQNAPTQIPIYTKIYQICHRL